MPSVVIISGDEDFSSVIGEQLKRQLSLQSAVALDLEAAAPLLADAQMVISDGVQAVPAMSIPVLILPRGRAPLRLKEVLEDVQAALEVTAEVIDIGAGYRFLPRAKQLQSVTGQSIELTDREMGLVAALLAAGDEGISKDALLKQVWGFEEGLNTHTLETHVYRLRSKVREAFGSEMIAAIDGGYKLEL